MNPASPTPIAGEARAEIGLDHPRSGEIVALSEPDAWFAYPFWLDDARRRPTTPGPWTSTASPATIRANCSSTPSSPLPKLRLARRLLLAKKLGFRTLFDVIPLDPSLVRGATA